MKLLYEEFKEYETLWDTQTKVHEAAPYPKKRADKVIAFMDFTGSSFQFRDLYERQMRKDVGKNGVYKEVKILRDTEMKALQDAVNSGEDVVLYTCDTDYKDNCPNIIGKSNFKVRLVNNGKNGDLKI
jgi:hypothetical protein